MTSLLLIVSDDRVEALYKKAAHDYMCIEYTKRSPIFSLIRTAHKQIGSLTEINHGCAILAYDEGIERDFTVRLNPQLPAGWSYGCSPTWYQASSDATRIQTALVCPLDPATSLPDDFPHVVEIISNTTNPWYSVTIKTDEHSVSTSVHAHPP